MTSAPKRVVIDTDAANEVDDQFAIAWALLAPEQLDLLEIHAAPFSHGSYFTALSAAVERRGTDPQTRFEEMAVGLTAEQIESMTRRRSPADGMLRSVAEIERVVDAFDLPSPPPVVAGADRFMTSADDAVDSDAVRRLIALAHADARPLYVAMMGAATNVASALVIDPTIADRIVPIFVAGYPTASPHVDDSFNLVQDRHATNHLFTSAQRLVYIPGHQVAVVLSVSLPEIDRHAAGRGAIGDLLVQLYHDNPLTTAPTVAGHSWVMWDLAPIAWLIDPSWVPTTDVDGATVGPDHRWATGERRLTEAFSVDRRGVYTDFFRRLAERHPLP